MVAMRPVFSSIGIASSQDDHASLALLVELIDSRATPWSSWSRVACPHVARVVGGIGRQIERQMPST